MKLTKTIFLLSIFIFLMAAILLANSAGPLPGTQPDSGNRAAFTVIITSNSMKEEASAECSKSAEHP